MKRWQARGAGGAARASLRAAANAARSCEQIHFAEGEARKFTQARLVGESLGVDARQPLEQAEAVGRRPALRGGFGVMKIGVAAMEQPVVRPPDRDVAMSAGVAGKRN
ncbi:MAG TPA: hypothetical protein VGG79_09840 [Roseiarcus sp.]